VLPTVDKQLFHIETRLHQRLAELELDSDPHARLLRQFAVWDQLPRLRAKARTQPLTPAARRFAGEQFTHTQAFLTWLEARGHAQPRSPRPTSTPGAPPIATTRSELSERF